MKNNNQSIFGKKMESFMHRTNRIWSDKLYLDFLFRLRMGYKIDWNNPKTFNEKLNWQKIYNRNTLYTKMVDKYDAKEYARSIIGDEYIVPCYGVWDDFDDINFDKLPNKFVLKATHDSSGVIICKDKQTFDKSMARSLLKRCAKRNWFSFYREWAYKDVKPRVLADKLLDEHTGRELRDYKFWCFNGMPKVMYLTNKGKKIYENFYDMDFKPLDINHGFDRMTPEFDKPEAFELMKSLAAKLSSNIPFVRIDFFYVDGKVYFGECTFYDWGGMQPFTDFEWDKKLGSWINLDIRQKM